MSRGAAAGASAVRRVGAAAVVAVIGLVFPPARSLAADDGPPNVVYVLCDDLGYGDVRCLNPDRCRIATPNLDRLAAAGMVFTNAHAGSAVCTPTRYGVLTGRHSWRSRLQSFILTVYDPPLIEADRPTVASLLADAGYRTAGFGKWHLGWNLPRDGQDIVPDGEIRDGPTSRGFHEYACNDQRFFPPFQYSANDRLVGPQLRPVRRPGAEHEPISLDEMADILPKTFDDPADCVKRQAAAGRRFFAYVAPITPHTPLAVGPEWKGRSGLGLYPDYVMQLDHEIGRLLEAIDVAGVTKNTLVIVTSDNGCAHYIGTRELETQGHFASGESRGYKADLWDGGHRVPFIVRWPARVKPGSRCDAGVCLTDLMATCAELTSRSLPDDAGEDSVSMMPLFLQKPGHARDSMIHHSVTGKFAIRAGRWKLLLCAGSGGWAEPDDPQAEARGLPAVQLYDMETDPGETKNLQAAHPEIVARLTTMLERQVAEGRSTPGQRRANDVPIDVWKGQARADR